MKKKIKKVIPIRSDTLCERCEYGVPREQKNGCIKARYGKPCLFFKKKVPSVQIGDFKYSFYDGRITLSFVGDNKPPQIKSVETCRNCKYGIANYCREIMCEDCELCVDEYSCKCDEVKKGEVCKHFKPIENEV